MKVFLFFFIFGCLNVYAQESYVQTYCRNGDNSLQINYGDAKNEIIVLIHAPNLARVALNFEEVNLEYSEAVKIESRSISTCSPQGTEGIKEWYAIRAQKVRLQKADGSSFDPSTVGVSPDLKFIESSVICDERGQREVQCGPEWLREEPPPETLHSRVL